MKCQYCGKYNFDLTHKKLSKKISNALVGNLDIQEWIGVGSTIAKLETDFLGAANIVSSYKASIDFIVIVGPMLKDRMIALKRQLEMNIDIYVDDNVFDSDWYLINSCKPYNSVQVKNNKVEIGDINLIIKISN